MYGFNGIEGALGRIPDIKMFHKFGHNSDVDAAEDIIAQGGDVLFSASGQLLEVVGALGDTQTGWVEGLRYPDFAWVRETFTLNGTTAVNLATTWYTVFRARLNGAVSAGTPVFRPQGGGATWLQIGPGFNGTLHASISNPVGTAIVLTGWDLEVTRPVAGSATVEFQLLTRPCGSTNGWTCSGTGEYYTEGGPLFQEFRSPILLEGPHDVKVRAAAVSAANLEISATIDGVFYGYGTRVIREEISS